MNSLDQTLASRLAEREAADLYRRRLRLGTPQGARVRVDGAELLNFCSNDYLGLAGHPDVAAALAQGAKRWGTGSGASHLVCGHTAEHEALEAELADWLGRPRALLFSTGFMANVGTIQALVGQGDAVFEDRLNHASLLDGGLASDARFARYAHNDAVALGSKLAGSDARHKLVVTDGVFSMDGDQAPLPALAKACAGHGAWLMVDDAHGLGVRGPEGRGSVAAAGLGAEEVPVLMATLGKALGVFGAFVAGSATLIEYLIQAARPYVYTTALPPAVAAANRAALGLARGPEGEARRARLAALIARFKAGAAELGLSLLPSDTAIQPLILGASAQALAASRRLKQAGILVGAIRPPTVPAGTARLRITLSANHAAEHVDRLLEALELTLNSVRPE